MLGGRTKMHPNNDGSRLVKRVWIIYDMLFDSLLIFTWKELMLDDTKIVLPGKE